MLESDLQVEAVEVVEGRIAKTRAQILQDARFERWKERHPGRYEEYQREYHAKHRAEVSAKMKLRRAETPEIFRDRLLKYRSANRKVVAEKQRVYYATNEAYRDRQSSVKAARRHGLSLDAYLLLLKENPVCEICGEPETNKRKDGSVWPLSIDHCHVSGEVRGVLCGHCNRGIGAFKDDPTLMLKAAVYMEKHMPKKEAKNLPHRFNNGSRPNDAGAQSGAHGESDAEIEAIMGDHASRGYKLTEGNDEDARDGEGAGN